ncbi:MAG: geranyl transferase [Arenimonas sp. SCN 70-307]|uniref:polyprenyl synthetase family protein n=1 Tax=Arenimonas sp. SCN 70-307 TaxID=1660089 RepID=UPI00086BD43C|nr:farnesyl diphosphate synthase [Arenimonas sp. SCN 70-307]ODS63999.1 MAG: geranyl transferase [Arenimonas sp. SCN 70-307]
MAPEPRLARWLQRVEARLEAALPASDESPQGLHRAMRHAVLGGGKRLRPMLVYAAGAATGADESLLDAPAAAVELVHAFSLVHDDLPAMDDDELRRGRPTVHVAFDEATAILAGDALQALGFSVLAEESRAPDALRVAWLATLARATGAAGMCGGQALDMDGTGAALALAELERLHALKTGALIRAAVRLGALAGRADAGTLAALDDYASALGLAFQIRDDLLDIEASSEQLGKTAGKDAAQAKSTYPALLGVDGAKAALARQVARMDAALSGLPGELDPLRALARLAVERSH